MKILPTILRAGGTTPPTLLRALARPSVAAATVLALTVAVLAAGTLAGCGGGAERSIAPAGKVSRWRCPMHPTVISDRPGDCPICHMTLIPDEEHADTPGSAPAPSERTSAGAPAPPAVPGTVRLSLARRQLIGVTTTPVTRAPFIRTIRAVGRVAFDETRLHHVHTKVAGYVEEVFAHAAGETVRQGQPLLSLYSPELLASQQEYLVALQARRRTAGSSLPSVAGSGEELVAASRRRLELLDVPAAQVEALERSGAVQRTIAVHAPSSGTILARNVQVGQRVAPEDTLFDLADLSRVWVIASIYEYELPFVRPGQNAAMSLSYLPGRRFDGTVALIYPTLDPATRTAQVRLEFPNPDGTLRPEMFADVELASDLGPRLSVPAEAVMDTGERIVAFVELEEGLFEPREVQVGVRLPDRVEILSGLGEGERVLASATFFVDSESRLKAAHALAQPPGPAEAAPPHEH